MKNIDKQNKGLMALAEKNPALVEERFGYDVPGYMYGGIAKFQYGGPAGGFNIDQDYIRDYYENVLGINIDELGEEGSEEGSAGAAGGVDPQGARPGQGPQGAPGREAELT